MSFKAFWLSAKDLFDELFALSIVNIIWVLFNLPFALIALVPLRAGAFGSLLIVMLLGVLPMAPATAGLYSVGERISEGRVAGWREFFEGLRAHWRLSLRVYGVWAIGLAVILINLQFYMGMDPTFGTWLSALFLYFLAVWLSLLIYIGPLMLIQSDTRLRVIARNAIMLSVSRPLFTLITSILMLVILLISLMVVVPLFVVTFAFLATWSFRATRMLIDDAIARQAALAEQAAQSEGQPAEKGRGGQIRPRQ